MYSPNHLGFPENHYPPYVWGWLYALVHRFSSVIKFSETDAVDEQIIPDFCLFRGIFLFFFSYTVIVMYHRLLLSNVSSSAGSLHRDVIVRNVSSFTLIPTPNYGHSWMICWFVFFFFSARISTRWTLQS